MVRAASGSCRARNASGDPCRSQPVRPSGYCWWHDGAAENERARKRQEGGINRATKARARKALAAGDALTAEQIRGHLSTVFLDVIAGTTDPTVGTAAATLARALLDVARVAEIEAQVGQMRRDMAAFAERRGVPS